MFEAEAKNSYSKVGLGCGLFLLASNLVNALLYLLCADTIAYDQWMIWIIQEFSIAAGVFVAWLAMRKVPKVHRPKEKLKPVQFILALSMMKAVSHLMAMIVILVFAAFSMVTGTDAEATAVVDEIVSADIWIQYVFVGLFGPVLEELLCRKLILDRTRAYGELNALVFSALVFGLIHANLYQLAYSFPAGLILGYVYLRTNDIRYSIFLHMGMNLTSLINLPFSDFVFGGLAIVGLAIYMERIYFRYEEKQIRKGSEVGVIFGNKGVIFAMVLILIEFVIMLYSY